MNKKLDVGKPVFTAQNNNGRTRYYAIADPESILSPTKLVRVLIEDVDFSLAGAA